VELLQDLDFHSRKGTIIEVAAGYGRNYLIANGFAKVAEEEAKHNEWDPKQLSESESLTKNIVLQEFRRQMYHGGVRKWSIRGLTRIFDSVAKRWHGHEGIDVLEEWQFTEAVNKFGVFLNKRATNTLFRLFDRDNNGVVDYNEFINALRGPLNERRYAIIMKAWESVVQKANSPTASTSLSIDEIHAAQTPPTEHLEVQTGLSNPMDAEIQSSEGLADFADKNGQLDKDAFCERFADISGVIDSDDIFVHMIERQFGIREKGDDHKTKVAVEKFKRDLLDKLHQKSFQGTGRERTLLRAFQMINSDSVGSITLGEFSAAMRNFGLEDGSEEVFAFLDKSGNNMISYDEFKSVMLS